MGCNTLDELGANPGDRVVVVGQTDAYRFQIGEVYTVEMDAFGRASVMPYGLAAHIGRLIASEGGRGMAARIGAHKSSLIPSRGVGAIWEFANE